MRFTNIRQQLCLILCGYVLVGCVHPALAPMKRELEVSLESLPKSAEFQNIATTELSVYASRFGGSCTYGRVSRALATAHTPKDAIARYLNLLQAAGWEVEDANSSVLLNRGQHERLVLRVVESDDQASVDPFRSMPAYRTAREQGQSVLILDLTYINPKRDGC